MHLVCHFAFWYGLLFANPVFVAAHNRVDLVFSVVSFAGWSGLAAVLASLASWGLARRFSARTQSRAAAVFLAAGFVIAIQGNVVHGLFDYGAFNGERVDYSQYGWKYWLELLAWLAAFPLVYKLLTRLKKVPAWLPALPVLSFSLLVLPILANPDSTAPAAAPEEAIDPSVFEFSSVSNLVHILPDGFQSDVVRQVFDSKPELAAKFEGFTLFNNHVSTNQGTAPALYTMLTGENFDLSHGFTYREVTPFIRENSYPAELARAGYRLDYVPVSGFICPESARNCIARPFNDMKARGLFRHRDEDLRYSVRLIADLSLFRLVPMYLKEKIHNDGRWFFADTTMDGSSPWPDPVIREWTENLRVTGEAPVYKWHHFVGTHIPAKWGRDCRLFSEPETERGGYLEQAECVLAGLGFFLDRLRTAGIYDQTAIIVSGDHGHNVAADDATGYALNRALTPPLQATGRPALLVKRKNNRSPLVMSEKPTSMTDIASTALSLSGIATAEPSVFEISFDGPRERLFRQYSTAHFYTGEPVPYVEYSVGPSARDAGGWAISDIRVFRDVPGSYDPLNRPNGKEFVHGAALRKSIGNNRSSWIPGRQLAFLIGLPDTSRNRILELSLHIPEWVGDQSFEARINGGEPWRSPVLSPDGEEWQTVNVPFPTDIQQAGNNFVSLVFDRLGQPPGDGEWQASARIRSIRTAEEIPAQSPATHQ